VRVREQEDLDQAALDELDALAEVASEEFVFSPQTFRVD
jgi:hypothetical protein